MPNLQIKLFAVLILWSFSQSVLAFNNGLNQRFPGFIYIKPENLEKTITHMPEQKKLWAGRYQCGNVIRLSELKVEKEVSIGFDHEIGKYPLSFNHKLFVLEPAPKNLTGYLNFFFEIKALPVRAHEQGFTKLELKDFLSIIQENVMNDLPTLAYTNLSGGIKIYSIVGLLKLENERDSQIILLKTTGAGIERLDSINAFEFLQHMNIAEEINSIKSINEKIEIGLWHPYTLITLKVHENNDDETCITM